WLASRNWRPYWARHPHTARLPGCRGWSRMWPSCSLNLGLVPRQRHVGENVDNLAGRSAERISAASAVEGVTRGYRERAAHWQAEADRDSRLARRWSWARLALFVTGAALLLIPVAAIVRTALIALVIAAYVFAARRHRLA